MGPLKHNQGYCMWFWRLVGIQVWTFSKKCKFSSDLQSPVTKWRHVRSKCLLVSDRYIEMFPIQCPCCLNGRHIKRTIAPVWGPNCHVGLEMGIGSVVGALKSWASGKQLHIYFIQQKSGFKSITQSRCYFQNYRLHEAPAFNSLLTSAWSQSSQLQSHHADVGPLFYLSMRACSNVLVFDWDCPVLTRTVLLSSSVSRGPTNIF